MNKCPSASPVCASHGSAKCGEMSRRESDPNEPIYESIIPQNEDCKSRQGPGHAMTHTQKPGERSLSKTSTSNMIPRSHQRRWSADFCKHGTAGVITVKKNIREPQPPQRGMSHHRSNSASHSSNKRYSCPPIGVFSSSSHPSSSSSLSSTSSCSSPPPVQTFVITGHDPLGWKLRPKSTSACPRARSKRLSLQIPLPVICPDPKSSPPPTSPSDNAPNADATRKTKPPLKPKPFLRRHSDSSAFLKSLTSPVPAVTLEELLAVQLNQVSISYESDDVFSEGNKEEARVTTHKIPPPVPEKTFMARQMAQLIAHSRRRSSHGKSETEENIYTGVVKPKPKHPHQTGDHSSRHGKKNAGLHVDSSCDRERSTPRFPG